MKTTGNTITIGTVAAIIAIGTSFNIFWNQWGWQTPENHDSDMVQQVTEQQQVSSAILIQLKSNRDEWWCDEEAEYLDELIRLKDGGNLSAAINQEILEQREKMTAVECHRFDND